MKQKTNKSTLAIIALLAICAVVSGFYGNETTIEGGMMCWIGAAIQAGTKIVGAAAGAAVSAAQAKKARAEMDKAQQYLDNWYNTTMNTSVLDRADTQAMLSDYRNTMAEQGQKYLNNAVKGGATEEGRIAYQTSANKGYADAISKMQAQAQAHKDQVSQSYMQSKMEHHNNLADQYLKAGQQMSSAISGAVGGAGDALGKVDWANIKKK